MTRYDILMGRNDLNVSFAGLGGTAQLKCDVMLGDTKLDTLLSEHDGKGYTLYDLQELMPSLMIELPVFTNGYAIYENFVQLLALKYYNDNQTQTVTKKIIPQAGVRGFSWVNGFGRFLTIQPTEQKTNFRSTEWLWYLLNYDEPVNNLKLKIEVTTLGKQLILTEVILPGYLQGKLIGLDVSAELVAELVKADVEKPYMESYRVWLEQDGERLSEYRTYYLVPVRAYQVELLVLNSFGVWDSVTLMATQKNSKDFDLQYAENGRSMKLTDAHWFSRYAFGISDLEQCWLTYLQELIISRKVYLRVGSELKAIVCTTKSLDDFYNNRAFDEASLEFREELTVRSVEL